MTAQSNDRPIYLGQTLWLVPLIAFVLFRMLLPGLEVGNQQIPVVCQVKADPVLANRAYLLVDRSNLCEWIKDSGTITQMGPSIAAYQTNDYGQTWRRLIDRNQIIGLFGSNTGQTMDIRIDSSGVWLKGNLIWSSPRQIFGRFMESHTWNAAVETLSYDIVNASAFSTDGKVLYAAVGPEGLLLISNPGQPSPGPITLVQTEIGLAPALTDSDPLTLIAHLIAIFCAPPLPWLFAWLIGQAYRYLYPIDETHKAMRLSLTVAGILTLLAIPLAVLWLTNAQVEYGTVLAILTISAVALSVGIGVWQARRRQFTDTFVRKFALATALLALIIPTTLALPLFSRDSSVLAAGWWAVLAAVIGFIRYRLALVSQIERFKARASRWQIDRLAMELPIITPLLLVPLAWLAIHLFFSTTTILLPGGILSSCIWPLALCIAVPFTCSLAVGAYTQWRGRNMTLKKHDPLALHDQPLFSEQSWKTTLTWETILWLLILVLLAMAVVVSSQSSQWI